MRILELQSIAWKGSVSVCEFITSNSYLSNYKDFLREVTGSTCTNKEFSAVPPSEISMVGFFFHTKPEKVSMDINSVIHSIKRSVLRCCINPSTKRLMCLITLWWLDQLSVLDWITFAYAFCWKLFYMY